MAVDTPQRKDAAQNKDPAIITDHEFVPRDEWWSLCKTCGLAQAAHAESSDEAIEAERKAHIAYYGDDNPEVFD